jgi:hemerythrin
MGLFAWQDEFAVGTAEIDSEHRALFRLAEELHESILNGAAEDDLEAIYARLAAYTREHCENEEAILRKQDGCDIQELSREHQRFTAKVNALERRLEKKQARLDVETMRFLRSWLDRHIQHMA